MTNKGMAVDLFRVADLVGDASPMIRPAGPPDLTWQGLLLQSPGVTSQAEIDAILLGGTTGGDRVDLVLGGSGHVMPVLPGRPVRIAEPAWVPIKRDEDGYPVTWPAGRPIKYAVNIEMGYRGFIDDVTRIMIEVRRMTGLQFDMWGPTSITREAYDAGRGPRDLDLLVAWVPSQAELRGTGRAIATGGTRVRHDEDLNRPVRCHGSMLFAADYPLKPGFVSGGWGPVIRHEAGHVAGLDHVPSGAEVMRPGSFESVIAWGPGDIRGLRALGAASVRQPIPVEAGMHSDLIGTRI